LLFFLLQVLLSLSLSLPQTGLFEIFLLEIKKYLLEKEEEEEEERNCDWPMYVSRGHEWKKEKKQNTTGS